MYDIIFYTTKDGISEIRQYLQELQMKKDKNSRVNLNKIIAYINILSKYGLNIGTPYIKHIKDDIQELRPIRNRILFAYLYNNKFILLTIFMKQTNKTPTRKIEKAIRYLEDFLNRSDRNEK